MVSKSRQETIANSKELSRFCFQKTYSLIVEKLFMIVDASDAVGITNISIVIFVSFMMSHD